MARGITAQGYCAGKKLWTSRELARLTLRWGSLSPETAERVLPGRTWDAIRLKAERMELGPAAGERVSIVKAATRAGYSTDGLLALLERQGVKTYRRWGQKPKRAKKNIHRTVIWEDVVEAVEAEKGRDPRMGARNRAATQAQA